MKPKTAFQQGEEDGLNNIKNNKYEGDARIAYLSGYKEGQKILEKSKIPSKVTQRRLRYRSEAMALKNPRTEREIIEQVDQLRDAIRAIQSLDDLGSVEANEAVMKDHDVLLRKLVLLENKLVKIKKGKRQ